MTVTVTVDQLRNLTDRAARGPLTADESARLRDGIDQLAHATDGELRRQLADIIRALGRSETALAGVRNACDQLRRASVLADGQAHTDRERGILQAVDRITATLAEQPADDARPTRQVHVTITNPDEYTANRAALSLTDWIAAEFPGHHVTTDAREWDGAPPVHVGDRANAEDCPACKVAAVPPPYPWICPGEEQPGPG